MEIDGMTEQISLSEAKRHDRLRDWAHGLSNGELMLDGVKTSSRVGFISRLKLALAIRFLEQAIDIYSEDWPAMWSLGKIYQRLQNDAKSLSYFSRAADIVPEHPDVSREAGVAALNLGDGPKAEFYCQAACRNAPEDSGLISNLACAYLINGHVERALSTAQEAIARNPDDHITKTVLRVIIEVTEGKRPRPNSLRNISPI